MMRFFFPLLTVLLLVPVSTAFAQSEQETPETPAASKYGPVYQLEIKDQTGEPFRGMKIEKEFARRLPNHYREVISDGQRDEIYAIQAAYFAPLEMLTLRLERLRAERDAQIEAVLTAEQKKQIETLRAEALERAAQRRTTTTARPAAN